MKKTVLALFVCITMSLSIVACGSSDTVVAAIETATQVEETKPEVEVEAPKAEVEDEAPKAEEPEEKKVEEIKPTEASEPTEEPKVEEAKPTETPEPIEEPKAEEMAEEKAETPKAEEDKPEEAKTEAEPEAADNQVEIQTEAATPAPVVTTVGTGTDLNSYIADGNFSDAISYGKAMGAYTGDIFTGNIDFNWPSYFIELSTSYQDTSQAYIAVGGWNGQKAERTYVYVVNFGEALDMSNGTTVSKNAVLLLPTVIKYMNSHPDPYSVPQINGMNGWITWAELVG